MNAAIQQMVVDQAKKAIREFERDEIAGIVIMPVHTTGAVEYWSAVPEPMVRQVIDVLISKILEYYLAKAASAQRATLPVPPKPN